MDIPQDLLKEESEEVRSKFLYWDDFMERNVEFWPLPGEFDVHTKGHCERVLLLALKIGELRRLGDRQLTALCHASIFHDSRRKDNYMDVGHGDRAADYYKDFCRQATIGFLPETYAAIKFHDRDDRLGEEYISRENISGGTEVYHDFKDADGLDRLRLGPWALDSKFLRTPEAKELMAFAQNLVEVTMPPAEYKKIMDATRPFANRFSNK